jgi:phage tail-like protein
MIPAGLLPPVLKPPHDPLTLVLTGAGSLRGETLDGVHLDSHTNRIVLDQARSVRRFLTEPSGTFGGLVLPTNVAMAADGSIYLLDRSTLTLKRFDPCECRFHPVPYFGGEGGGVRQLRNPSGIGICDDKLFVCDTGLESSPISCKEPSAPEKIRRENHRLVVLSLDSFGLQGHWSPPPSAYEGAEPKLRMRPWQPVDVDFDGQGRVYVSDPANGCIHRFSSRGVWLGRFADIGPVTHIAIDCRERIHARIDGKPLIKVIDIATGTVQEVEAGDVRQGEGIAKESGTNSLVAGGSKNKEKWPQDFAKCFRCLPFPIDREGCLHLGRFCAGATDSSRCQADRDGMEPGVFDLNGNPVSVSQHSGQVLFVNNGSLITSALDSELYRCVWHRVLLFADIPQGTTLELETVTSEVELPDEEVQTIFLQRQVTTPVMPHDVRNGMADALVRSPAGRYLWIKLNFLGNGQATPRLMDIEVEFPRISLRRYLPAVFGEEPMSADFTDRFLALYDTTLRSIESKIDRLAGYFDPLSAPADRRTVGQVDFLSWLGSWIGVAVDRNWPEAKRRRWLKQAGKLFDLRGTREGLWRQLVLFLELEPDRLCCPDDQPKRRCRPTPYNCEPSKTVPCHWQPPPLILEHFKLRRWLFLGAGRLGDQAVLWGKRIVNRSQLNEGAQVDRSQLITTPDPYRDPFHVYAHKFTVFVPASYKQSERGRKALANLLKSESPAHTAYAVEYVEPRFRIGFQSMIGFDAVVGRYPQGVTLDGTRLGWGSVVSGGPTMAQGPSLRVGKEARVGSTTVIA